VDKTEMLKEKARAFRALLAAHDWKNTDAELLLRWLTPLFDDIEAGKISPPQRYNYRMALGKDNPFYEQDSPFMKAEAQFVAALEDWESQAWYQEAMKRTDGKNNK
jgi:hypothetical protein